MKKSRVTHGFFFSQHRPRRAERKAMCLIHDSFAAWTNRKGTAVFKCSYRKKLVGGIRVF
ncbi:hypothetical protein BJQ97_00508 [Geobacillus sp. TFV-3]|nr:hypothetical protein BJQ97_00508 [Geobacillus sp. TFV-3]